MGRPDVDQMSTTAWTVRRSWRAIDDPDDGETADGTPEARFGAELRRLRVRAGLSVRRLAEELHRAHSGIVDYERGRRLPGVEVVEQYEDYFGLARGTLVAQRERARAERLEQPRDATVDEHLGDVACPYKGLRAVRVRGRGAVLRSRGAGRSEVLARLAEARFVAVVGASGSGKSSFVRAGLLAGIDARAASADRPAARRAADARRASRSTSSRARSAPRSGVTPSRRRGSARRPRRAGARGPSRGDGRLS